jgi:hypothetical protein
VTTSQTTVRPTSRSSIARALIAGAVGGTVFNIVGFLTFVLIGTGLDNSGPLLDSGLQSRKVIAVWTTMQPLPKFQTAPMAILAIYMLLGAGYALLFRSVERAWPKGFAQRTARLGSTIWGLSCVFFELLGPFNLLGEPLALVGLELAFWGLMALAAAAVIVAFVDGRAKTGQDGW